MEAETISLQVLDAFTAFWATVLGFMPNLIAAVLLLVLGFVLAKISRYVVDRVLALLRFDSLAQKTGLESYFSSTGYEITFSRLISGTIFWLIILLTISSMADLLHLQIISDLFTRLVIYLPNVIFAVMILILGTIFARIVNRYVFNTVKERSMDLALSLGIVAEVIVQIFVWFLALEQLQINTTLLIIVLISVCGFLATAGAIAFGLAGQKMAGEMLQRMRDKVEGGIDE